MRFEWDEDKNRRNLVKHKVSFETASLVFDDPRMVSIQDRMVEGEERWQGPHLSRRSWRRGHPPDFGSEGGCE